MLLLRGRRLGATLAATFFIALLVDCSDKDIERTLGKQAAAAIESAYKVADDPLLSTYVNTMGHILVGHSKRQDIPYEFKVIETDVVNAAAAPYGYVYVTTGLLDFVESEDELWAITAHEIGHEVGRDSVKAAKENLLLSLAQVLIASETKVGGRLAEFGFGLLSLSHSREDEYRADDHGTAATYAAGYDPSAQTVFFERLMKEVEKTRPSRLETLFLTHPPTKARIARQQDTPLGGLTDPDAMAEVAAGYARRARYAQAIALLRKTLESQPDSAPARALLADCYLARGDCAKAAEEYAAVLRADPSLASAQEGLRAAEAGPPVVPFVPASPTETAAAAAAVQEAAQRLAAAGEEVKAATANLPSDLAPTGKAVKASSESLLSLGEVARRLPPAASSITIDAAEAVGEANESVCTVEQVGRTADDVMAGLDRTVAAARAVAGGQLTEAETAILARSAREVDRCGRELSALANDLPPLVKSVQNAGRIAQTATGRLEQAFAPAATMADRQIAGDAVKLTRQRSSKAKEEAHLAAERAVLAKTRSLVAEINVAAIALGTQRVGATDRVVAYYTQSDPDQVRSLREASHLGLGEAALLLASGRSARRPVDSLLTAAGETLELTDAANAAGARLRYVNLFLRFIADALAREAALA